VKETESWFERGFAFVAGGMAALILIPAVGVLLAVLIGWILGT
jgi:hypothetical protein